MMHKAWSSIVEVPYCFSRSYVKFQGHTALKNRRIWPKLGVSGQQLQFEFTDGYEMLHKAWNSKGEVPYCFPRSSIKFQGNTGQNITDFDPNWAFPDYRPVAAFKSLRFALFFHLPIVIISCHIQLFCNKTLVYQYQLSIIAQTWTKCFLFSKIADILQTLSGFLSLYENFRISIQISLKFVRWGPIDCKSVMA